MFEESTPSARRAWLSTIAPSAKLNPGANAERQLALCLKVWVPLCFLYQLRLCYDLLFNYDAFQ